MDALFDLLIEDHALTSVAVFGMSEPTLLWLRLQQPWVSVDNDSSGTSPDGILGRNIPIRARMERFLASCGNTFARSTSSRSKTPSGNFLHWPRTTHALRRSRCPKGRFVCGHRHF